MNDKIRPLNVTADKSQRIVTIEWSDGRTCDYPFPGLRAICPCVTCRGSHDNMGQPADRTLLALARDDSLELRGINAVGSYAIQLEWGDGHNTGIYTWSYLREACLDT